MPVTSTFDPEVVFHVVCDAARRRLLAALAGGAKLSATALRSASRLQLDATLKHLVVLRNAGLVFTLDDPQDGRRQLYQMSASVPVVRTGAGIEIDFGCCLLRL